MTNTKYVTVNDGQDLWEIDFDEGMAVHTDQRITIDDLDINGIDYIKYDGYIGDYIEDMEYTIKQESETQIVFGN